MVSLAYDPDGGKFLAAVLASGAVQLWDLDTRRASAAHRRAPKVALFSACCQP